MSELGAENRNSAADRAGRGGAGDDDDDSGKVIAPFAKRGALQRAAGRAPEPLPDEGEPKPGPGRVEPAPEAAPAQIYVLPPLPEPESRGLTVGLISFVLCVLLPTIATATYFFVFAANQYVSEFRFSVQQSTVTTTMSPAAAPSAGNSGMMGGVAATMLGIGGAGMAQNFVVVDYLNSRQAIVDAGKKLGDVRQFYEVKTSPADWLASFPTNKPIDKFVDYWDGMVSANFDLTTGLATVRVRAFRPEDARAIAESLVQLSEELVNSIAKRMSENAVRFAQSEVERADERLKSVRSKIAAFRAEHGVIDPTLTVQTNVDLEKQLRGMLLSYQADLVALGDQQLAASAPQAQLLRSRIAATQDELTKVEREVAKTKSGLAQASLDKIVSEYEKLDLDRQYAASLVVSTRQALDQARANAAAQTLYLTPYVQPDTPDSSAYPLRGQWTFIVFLTTFLVWVGLLMVARSIREHMR